MMMSSQGEAMNLEQSVTLVDYHCWARDRILDAVQPLTHEQYTRDMGNSFRSIRDTLVHIYGADLVWYERWRGGSPRALADPSGFPDVPSLRRAWTDLGRMYREHVEELGEDGISRVLHYHLLNGQPCANAFWEMLQHVVNHGCYHRGQLTTMLRQLGATAPKPMDLIVFYRERQAGAGTVR
jgi:uncharacterized damage-inducible protein DinB